MCPYDALDLLRDLLWRTLAVNAVIVWPPVVFNQRAAQRVIGFQPLPHDILGIVVSLDEGFTIAVAVAAARRPLIEQVVDAAA